MQTKRIPLLVLFFVLALAGTARADTFTIDGLTADAYGTPTNGRVFMFHQLNGNRPGLGNNAPLPQLVADGYQVIVSDEPYDQGSQSQGEALRAAFLSDSTAGQSYRDMWARNSRDLIAAADARYGTAPRLLMSGISWGGFSALLAACSNPEVDGYVVTIPAVDPNGLPEWADVPLENLKLWNQGCSDRLAAMPGFLAWGDRDTRVGTAGTRQLLPLLGDSATACGYPMGHDVPKVTTDGMTRWVQGARDCLPYQADPVAPSSSVSAPSSPLTMQAPTSAQPSVPSQTLPVASPGRRLSLCTRARHCENIIRGHKLFHVYNRRSKHPHWVYVRKTRR